MQISAHEELTWRRRPISSIDGQN